MSTNRHGPYPDQFRAEAAAMVIELGKSQVDVCQELGVSKSALSKWVAAARGDAPAKAGDPSAPTGKVVELEREVARLRQENSFLKKAAAFFARESE
ncbi:MAG: transposase [Bifidobacteriaceae bacterium]|nr:transposase [Bifidobacteriaceae bacterium]